MVIGSIRSDKVASKIYQNPNMAGRWRITAGHILPGWPEPGHELSSRAVGWISDEGLYGFVEFSAEPVEGGLLEVLEERFPGRRWFIGEAAASATETPRRLAA